MGDYLFPDTSNENVALQTFGYVSWVNDKVMAEYLPEAVDSEGALAERMGLIHMPLEERAGKGKQRPRKVSPKSKSPTMKLGLSKRKSQGGDGISGSKGWRSIKSILHASDSFGKSSTPETRPSTRCESRGPEENEIDEPKDVVLDPVAARLKMALKGERDQAKLKAIKHSDKAVNRLSKLAFPRISLVGREKRTTIALMPSNNTNSHIPAGFESSCLSRGPFRQKIEFEKIDPQIRKGRWMIHLLSDNDEDITFESLSKGGPQMLITCHNDVHHGEYNPEVRDEEEEKDYEQNQHVPMAADSKVKACPFCRIAEPVDAIHLACGHSFCRAHLGDLLRTWESSGIHTCPMCGEVEPLFDVLQLHSKQFDNKSAMTNDVLGMQAMSFGSGMTSPRMKVNKPRSQPQQGKPSARRREAGHRPA